MITMEMIGKIRRMHFRDGLSLHQIAKRTGISRNTIRKWVRAPKLDNPPKYSRRTTPGKLAPHSAFLQTALKADALRPKSTAARCGLFLRKFRSRAIPAATAG